MPDVEYESLKPTPQGPWFPVRREALRRFQGLGLRTGDIVCRLGAAIMDPTLFMVNPLELLVDVPGWVRTEAEKIPFASKPVAVKAIIPFSAEIAKASHSEYSHAAMIYDGTGRITIADVDSNGFQFKIMTDWIADVHGDSVTVLRVEGLDQEKCRAELDKVADLDPAYDGDFDDVDDRLYCTELPASICLRLGVPLGLPTPFEQLPGWTPWHSLFAEIGKVPWRKSVFVVGNSQIGLLASPHVRTLAVVKLEDMKGSTP